MILVLIDYRTVEYLRHGPDVFHLDKDGRMLPPPPFSFVDYAGFGLLILLQILLVMGLLRVYGRKSRV